MTIAELHPSAELSSSSASDLGGFLELVAPQISRARARLRRALRALHDTLAPTQRFDVERVEAALFAPMPDRLIRMSSRTLVLELRVADLQGLLHGDTPGARYDHFVERLRRPSVADGILAEYPVLAELLVGALDRWVDASTSVMQHLCEDWGLLASTFGDVDTLVDVRPGAGDLHRGGRSVCILAFAGGRRLVYKPRSLAADLHVQALLGWLDARDGAEHPAFRTITVLDRVDHGWVEWVEAAPATTETIAKLYYRRLGGLLAVAYVLDAIDLHYENVIAAGEHPVLLDLETLFHPHLVALDEDVARERALGALTHSVMGPGLLPQRLYGGATDTGIDVSGLGLADAQETPFEVPRWSGVRTSEMSMTRVRARFGGSHNRTRIDGVPTDPVRFADDLLAGFTAIYRLCCRDRDALLAADGPIAAFADDEVRVLLRSTRTYFRLLDESHHPDVLRDASDRDELFDSLRRTIAVSPVLEHAIPAERRDLWRGDVPLFTTTPASHDLVDQEGNRIAGVLTPSGLERVRRRILDLGDADLEHQRWLVAASLSTLASPHRPTPPARDAGRAVGPMTRERSLAAAAAIGRRLVATAIRGRHDATWLGLTSLGDQGARLEPLGIDLYDGLPGVALFLAHLGAITADAESTALSRAVLVGLQHRLTTEPPASPGAFLGVGGILYTYAHLAALWSDAGLVAEAHRLAATLPSLVEEDAMFDVVGGTAGAVFGLSSLWAIDPTDAVRDVGIVCGERLRASVLLQAQGSAWPSPVRGTEPLTGMSHGAAGIAAALADLAEITRDDTLYELARAAIDYERSLFAPELGNWRDLRFGDAQCQTAWCHGAPGIGLARLRTRLPGAADASRLAEDIDVAVATTVAHGFAGSHCLCHGGFGNLELLLQASLAASDERRAHELTGMLDRWAAILVDEVERSGPRCATKLGIPTPGMMSGMAGVGLQLLRLAMPERVPSVLSLARPPRPGMHA